MPSRRTVVEAGIAAVGVAGGVIASELLFRRHRRPSDEAPPALAAPDEAWSTPGETPLETPLLEGVEEIVLVLSDETRMRVLTRGSGPAVVLLHGITLSADIWFNQLRDLGDAGFRVVAPDLRGHGRTTIGSGGLRLDRVADDIAELLERLDLDDVVLVGHSMGGMAALRLLTRDETPAAMYPARARGPGRRGRRWVDGYPPGDARRRVRALGLVATSASPVVGRGVPGVRAVITLAAPLLGATGRLTSSLPGPSLPDTAVADPLARMAFGTESSPEDVRLIRGMTSMVPARVAAALLVQMVSFDAERELGRVVLPTTVVVGTDDAMTPLRHAETLARAIPGAELLVLPACGHMVMLERPAELAAAIVALADRAGPARRGTHRPDPDP